MRHFYLMEFGILLKNIVIIAMIFTVAFASQQPYFRATGKDFSDKARHQGDIYWSKASAWFSTNVYPRVSGEVGKIQENATQEITKQKNNVLQNIWEKCKNYFAQKFSETFGTEVR